MLRTYRYQLRANKVQRETFERWRGACQRLYNAALEQRRNAWERQRKAVTYNMQSADLTELRADGEYADIPVEVARSALQRLDRAFKSFFRRVKTGDKPGHPRFRSVDRYDSFSLGQRHVIDGDRIHVPVLGWVRFHKYRELEGDVRHVEIKRDARGRWFVCIVCDLGDAPAKVPVRTATGIDLGLTTFAALSDGTLIDNPRWFRHGQETLARRQRVLARKRRGSHGRRRVRRLVARAHEHVRSQRRDFMYKLATYLFEQYDLVSHEDLNIAGLARGQLAKSVADAAWGTFIRILTCKAESAGKWVVPVDPRGTSQRCSECGATVKKALSERVHRCDCGYVADRDVNAARNVLALGRSAADVPAEGSKLTCCPKSGRRRAQQIADSLGSK